MAAGAASFLSPCVLPLVPSFLGFLAQSGSQPPSDPSRGLDVRGRLRRRSRVVAGALGFVVGLSIILTTFFYALYRLLEPWKHVTLPVLGALVIALGLSFMGILRLPWLAREVRWLPSGFNKGGFLAGLFLGLGFGAGWTPCIGPVLGTILAVAGAEQTVGRGAGLLAAYSLGLGIPFLAAGFFAAPFVHFLGRFRLYLGTVEKVMGGLLVVTGILFITGQISMISYWLLATFPALGNIG